MLARLHKGVRIVFSLFLLTAPALAAEAPGLRSGS